MTSLRSALMALGCFSALSSMAPALAAEALPSSIAVQSDTLAALDALGLEEEGVARWSERVIGQGEVVFTGFAVNSPDGRIEAGTLTFEGLRLENGVARFDALRAIDGAFFEPDTPEPVRFESLALEGPSASLVTMVGDIFRGRERDAYQGVEFSNFEILDISGAGKGETGAAFTVEEVSASGYDGDTLGRMRMSQLRMFGRDSDGEDLEIRLDLAELSGLAISEEAINLRMDGLMDGAFKPEQTYESSVLRGFSLEGSGIRLAMPTADVNGSTTSEGVFRTEVRVPSMTLDFDPNLSQEAAMLANQMAALGIENFDFAMNGVLEFDAETERMRTVEDFEISANSLATFSMGMDMGGFVSFNRALQAWQEQTADKVRPADAPEPEIPAEINNLLILHNMSMAVEDEGLLSLVFEMMAAQQGTTAEKMRTQASMMAGLFAMGAASELPGSLGQDLQSALTGFIASGGRIEFSMAPANPLPFGSLESLEGGDVFSELGLEITHSAP